MPESTGMMHFYKKDGKWVYVTAEEYASKKQSLPDICFATKHRIADLNSKNFPDLSQLQSLISANKIAEV